MRLLNGAFKNILEMRTNELVSRNRNGWSAWLKRTCVLHKDMCYIHMYI